MSKVVKLENWRVEITPDPRAYDMYVLMRKENRIKHICEDIRGAVLKHINYTEFVEVKHDTVEICSFCGLTWEETEECCDEALEELKQRQVTQ